MPDDRLPDAVPTEDASAVPQRDRLAGEPPSADAPTVARSAEEEAADARAALQARRLEQLLRDIREQPDFASGKASVLSLQQTARSERAHTRALVDLIHDDPAMAGKLLRLINAAYYSAVGGGEITSMGRAIALMGFHSVGLLAGSLALYERLPATGHGRQLRRDFACALYAASLAHELCHDRQWIDSVYLGALFHRLGELLVGLHAQDTLQLFDDELEDRGLTLGSEDHRAARERLAREHWGAGIEDIGVEVATSWGWPPQIRTGMLSLTVDDGETPLEGATYLRVLCTTSHRAAAELITLHPAEAQEARAAALQRHFGPMAGALGVDPAAFTERLEGLHRTWHELVRLLGVEFEDGTGSAPATMARDPKLPAPGSREARQALAENLADAVQALSRLAQRDTPPGQLLHTGAELIQRALRLQRVIICLREDARPGMLCGHTGCGDRAAVLMRHFRIPLEPPEDLFGLLCAKRVDTLISDATEAQIARRLPPWFARKVRAGTFIVLPLAQGPTVAGLIYGDAAMAGSLHVHDRALELLQQLRQPLLRAVAGAP